MELKGDKGSYRFARPLDRELKANSFDYGLRYTNKSIGFNS